MQVRVNADQPLVRAALRARRDRQCPAARQRQQIGRREAVAGAGAGAFSKAQESARAKAQDQIKGFYKDILDREAEQAGIDGWLNALKSGQAIGQVRRGIAESNEAKNKVKDLYRKMLCRESDPDGLKGWINALADGWSLRRVADEGFAGSQEYKNRGGRPCS